MSVTNSCGRLYSSFPSSSVMMSFPFALLFLVFYGCASSNQPKTSSAVFSSTTTLAPTGEQTQFTGSTSATTSTVARMSTLRRLFTTSTTTTMRPLSDEEMIVARYCELLGTSCDKIDLSGEWFDELLGTFSGKESLRSSLVLTYRRIRQSLPVHVDSGVRAPHCDITRTLAALTVMRDYHNEPSMRDVAVFSARKLVGDEVSRFCDTSTYVLLDGKLGPSADREIIHRIHLHLIVFASLYPEVPLMVFEAAQRTSVVVSGEWLISLDQCLMLALKRAFVDYPKYSISSLRNQISAL